MSSLLFETTTQDPLVLTTLCTHGTSAFLWLVIVGGFVAFAMAWGIGANAFATSVGAKAITLKQAMILAGIFEFAGAFFLGSKVTDTVRKSIVDNEKFGEIPDILMLGYFCALTSASFILYLVTKYSLPVSTTQCIIGAIIGFTLVAKGDGAVDWNQVENIVIFWIATPGLAAVGSVVIFLIIRTFWLRGENATSKVYSSWGVFAMLVVWIMSFFMIMKGLKRFDVDDMGIKKAAWLSLIVGISGGGILWLSLYFSDVLRKHMYEGRDTANTTNSQVELDNKMKRVTSTSTNKELEIINKTTVDTPNIDINIIYNKENEGDGNIQSSHKLDPEKEDSPQPIDKIDKNKESSGENRSMIIKTIMSGVEKDVYSDLDKLEMVMMQKCEKFPPEVERGFQWLQVTSASLDILAHGSNDVANAIAPFAAMVALYRVPDATRDDVNVPVWVLLLGALGMVIGLGTYGYKVIKSIGVRLIPMSCTRGYCIELSSALVVIIASYYGYPASTTHAQVGATVGIGLVEYFRKDSELKFSEVVNWKLLAQVFISWIFALVGGAVLSAFIFALFAHTPSLV